MGQAEPSELLQLGKLCRQVLEGVLIQVEDSQRGHPRDADNVLGCEIEADQAQVQQRLEGRQSAGEDAAKDDVAVEEETRQKSRRGPRQL